jgi:hypothetical protein
MSGDSLIVGLNRVHHRENSLADGTGNNRIVSDNPRGLNGSTQHSAETRRDHRHNRTSHLSGYVTYQELPEIFSGKLPYVQEVVWVSPLAINETRYRIWK